MKVQDIMTKKIISIKATTPLVKIVALMRQYNISNLPVLDNENQLIGIVRERNLMSYESNLHLPSYIQFLEILSVKGDDQSIQQSLEAITQMPAQKIMEREVPVVRPTTDVRVVASIFTERDISSVPVINKKQEVVGIVSRVDLLGLMQQPKIIPKEPGKSSDYYYQILRL